MTLVQVVEDYKADNSKLFRISSEDLICNLPRFGIPMPTDKGMVDCAIGSKCIIDDKPYTLFLDKTNVWEYNYGYYDKIQSLVKTVEGSSSESDNSLLVSSVIQTSDWDANTKKATVSLPGLSNFVGDYESDDICLDAVYYDSEVGESVENMLLNSIIDVIDLTDDKTGIIISCETIPTANIVLAFKFLKEV